MTTPVPQRDQAWLTTATPEQVAHAHHAGELAQLLGQPIPRQVAPGAQLTAEQLAQLSPDEVAAAYQAGACDQLLGRGATAAL